MTRPRPRILVTAGSIRSGSYSAALGALAVQILANRDVEVTRVSLADHPLPIYDADLEADAGIPEQARRLHGLFSAHDGVFISTPEYNASLPPLLKNSIDWMSRVRRGERGPSPWRDRVYALGSTSPGRYGGLKAILHLRQVLEIGLGAMVIPNQMVVPQAASAFAADGSLKDEKTSAHLDAVLDRLVTEAGRYATAV
jgi:chromate reductase, NAD(P)H dehydrogenase (quinone)